MRWEGYVARMGERRDVYWVLVRKPEGKRPLERPRHIWKDTIKMELQDVGWGGGGMNLLDLAKDRDGWWTLLNAVMDLRV